jgi:hypothetical protein
MRRSLRLWQHPKLPYKIPTGGKQSEDNGNDNGNGDNGGCDSGELLSQGWREKHASDSEAIVKAERCGEEGQDTTQLQQRTVEYLSRRVVKDEREVTSTKRR